MLALLVIYQTPRGGQEPKGFGCCRGVLVHMSLYYWNSVGPVVADLLGWYAFSKAGPKNVFQLQVHGTNLCATQLYPKVPGHRIQGGCNKSETVVSQERRKFSLLVREESVAQLSLCVLCEVGNMKWEIDRQIGAALALRLTQL